MKRIFIILIIAMLFLCSCKSGNREKMNIDVSESTAPSNETSGTADTILDEDSQHSSPTEPIAADISKATV